MVVENMWHNYSLKDLLVLHDQKRVPLSAMERATRKGQYPYYGATAVVDYVDNYLFDGDYILLGEDGSVMTPSGKPILQLIHGKCWVNNHAHVITASDIVDFRFLYYGLMNIDVRSIVTGAVQPKISQSNLFRLTMPIPDLPTQRKIAAVLGCLDDKLELNNKINANLEQQAQALFKSWFIDFEPFGGTMPTDWREEDIYSIANIVYGVPFSSKLFNTDKQGMPIVRIRDLKEQSTETYTTEQHPKGYLIQAGDIVVGMDGEFRPCIWGGERAWLNQRVCVFQNKRSQGKAFLYQTIKPLLHKEEETQVATTVIHIGKKEFDAFRMRLPSLDVLDRFDHLTAPLVECYVSNLAENRRLSALRDTLLPHLLSGAMT